MTMMTSQKIHPHDIGLSETAIRKRQRSRRLARIMLTIALITAAAGWFLFGTSIFNAIHIKDQPPSLAIVAYALLIISSATLVLGFWYILLAQVERLAHMVENAEGEAEQELAPPASTCSGCKRSVETSDRF